ncbi:LysM peptidoglycan-binding domain-containing protein [Streptomyces sp. NPDC050315]|uniref:LysM peptidoglycan-binding domain-containing protein n=1 Tax=Streptomyces sp. NPDC050315 TaxID=3155039 RepID=UPI0034251270
MAHHTPGPLRAAGLLLRALLGLTVLAALVLGVPYALLTVGHQPTELSGGLEMLLRPDDGRLFLVVLTCLGWAAWALFTVSVLVEVVAVLRRRSAPRVRGLGGLQSLASFLIGAIVLLAPSAASAATPTAVAATATHSVGDAASASSSSSATSVKGGEKASNPTHTVTSPRETLWDLAETYLGSGQRWKDIAALNEGISGDTALQPGTVLTLPADARPAPATTTSTDGASPTGASATGGHGEQVAEKTYTVESGDTLYGIAEDQLGDGGKYGQIFEANRGEALPGGGTFTDPDLILPGQRLDLPTATAQPSPSDDDQREQPAEPDHDTPEHSAQTPPADPAPAPGQEEQPDTAKPAPQPSVGEQAPEHDARQQEPPAPSAAAPDRSPATDASGPAASSVSDRTEVAWAIGGGVLAAGVLTALATRRILQQRRRRRGRRIALPEAGPAATEQAMRATQALTEVEVLDAALRTAAIHLTAAGRELPDLAAAVIGPHALTLYLTEPAEPVEPFTAVREQPTAWSCSLSSTRILPAEQTDDVDAPYPALVTLGWDEVGQLVLADLEHIGILRITGEDRHRVLRTLALELATSTLADHLHLAAVHDAGPGLAGVVPERLVEHEGLADAVASARSHHADQQRALQAVGAQSLRAARIGTDAAAAWEPHIILAGDLREDEDGLLDELGELIASQPRTATAVITAADTDVDADGWTLRADPHGAPVLLPVPGVELRCTPQVLGDAEYADCLAVLNTTEHNDVPGPGASNDEVATAPAESETSVPSVPVALSVVKSTPAVEASAGSIPSLSLLAEFADLEEGEPVAAAAEDAGAADDSDVALPAQQHTEPEAPALAVAPSPTEDEPASAAPPPSPDATPAADAQTATTPMTGDTPVPASEEQGPVVRVLGPVEVTGARGRTESRRERTSTELAAWLILHPGRDHHALDEALWPGREVSRKVRNSTVSRLRAWLGTDEDGTPYLPAIASTAGARYALADTVTCDWHRFQQLAADGTAQPGSSGTALLRQALELVRGRPFASVNPRRYVWAEHLAQDMIAAIVDVAAELAERYLAGRDPRGALWAASKGLEAAPEMEHLYRLLFQAYAAVGDLDSLERAAQQLDHLNEELGVELEEATAELLRRLLTAA